MTQSPWDCHPLYRVYVKQCVSLEQRTQCDSIGINWPKQTVNVCRTDFEPFERFHTIPQHRSENQVLITSSTGSDSVWDSRKYAVAFSTSKNLAFLTESPFIRLVYIENHGKWFGASLSVCQSDHWISIEFIVVLRKRLWIKRRSNEIERREVMNVRLDFSLQLEFHSWILVSVLAKNLWVSSYTLNSLGWALDKRNQLSISEMQDET